MFVVFLSACAVLPSEPQPPIIACPADAKLCPDGSAVGRIGPDCDFAPCLTPVPDKYFCEADDDCVCDGFDTAEDQCFVGNRQYYEYYVDKERQCPDFCTGIAGHLETRCVENSCRIVPREQPTGSWLEIRAVPYTGEVPLVVNLTAVLHGAENAPERFYCAAYNWDFGDGKTEGATPRCREYSPEFEVQTVYETTHRYELPGDYNVTFTLGDLSTQFVNILVAPELLPPECDEDSDCAPAQCCHAADCVMYEKRPDCSKVACTLECRPGTLDCGGGCACVRGRCTGQNFYPGVDTTARRPWAALT